MSPLRNITVALLATLAFAAPSQAAAVLFDDNFDTNTIAVPGTPAGWTTFQGTVDRIGQIGASTAFDFLPGNGIYIDMDGSSYPNYAQGGIRTNQTFDFVPGATYMLSYSLAGSQRHDPLSTDTVEAYISNGGPNVTFTSHTLASATGFTNFVDTFTVGAPVNMAQIFVRAASGVSDNVGLLLDNVKLTAVPLPAAVWLLLSGIAGLGAFARRRRAAAAT
jgi:hypothetical protein